MTTIEQQALQLAMAILNGEKELLLGAREMAAYSFGLPKSLDQFLIGFIAVDSETDDLPLGAERELWLPSSLARADPEINRATELYRVGILEDCRQLIEALSVGESFEEGAKKKLEG